MKQNIRALSLSELQAFLKDWGVEGFRFQQVMQWLYLYDLADFSEMTNLSKELRQRLNEAFTIERFQDFVEQKSSDGTRKFLFRLSDGETIESVLIPNDDRLTLCISSQAGCAMACRYCFTGRVGLKRNLTLFEIVEQVMMAKRQLNPDQRITNIVFMGMGEPMENLTAVLQSLEILTHERGLKISKNRITVSTCGLVPQMLEFGTHHAAKLAISLSATTDELRNVLVPVNKRYPLKTLMDACRNYSLPNRGRITFEYVVLDEVNDGLDDAKRMVQLLEGIPSKINLIPFNEFPESGLRRPSDERVLQMQDYLLKRGLQTNIRASRGRDILGACGQLKAAMEPRKRQPFDFEKLKLGV